MFPVGESGSFYSQIQKTVVLMCHFDASQCIQTGIVLETELFLPKGFIPHVLGAGLFFFLFFFF